MKIFTNKKQYNVIFLETALLSMSGPPKGVSKFDKFYAWDAGSLAARWFLVNSASWAAGAQ